MNISLATLYGYSSELRKIAAAADQNTPVEMTDASAQAKKATKDATPKKTKIDTAQVVSLKAPAKDKPSIPKVEATVEAPGVDESAVG